MALDKLSARKPAASNAAQDSSLSAGDEHGLNGFYDTTAANSTTEAISLGGEGGITSAISITNSTAYTQDFSALSSAAADTLSSTVPTDWAFNETGTGANTTYRTGTGSNNAGDTYSFGSALAADRAFGTLLSGSVVPTIGASFTNNTGGTITSLLISYFGELWRVGQASDTNADRLDFQYSTDATSLTTGTWNDVNTLDYTSTVSNTTSGAKDGNNSGFRTSISNSITSLTIVNGATFWMRWVDFNKPNSDDGLAVDDFSLTASFGPPGSLAINDVTANEGNTGTTNFTFTVTRSGGTAGTVGATWTLTLSGTANAADFSPSSQTGTVSFADGETSKQVTITVAGDLVYENNETFTVVLSAPTGGATISDDTGAGTITNDDAPVAPTVDLDGNQPGTGYAGSFFEQNANVPIGSAIAVTQGSLPITSATVTITDALAGDSLQVSSALPAGIIYGAGSTATTLILTGTGTAADWEAALATVTYYSTSDNPDNYGTDTARTISVTLSDGVAPGAAAIATIAINADNDAPVVGNLAGDSVGYTEGAAYVLLDLGGNATVSDADSANFAGGSLVFGMLGLEKPGDSIFVAVVGNVTVDGFDVKVSGVTIGAIAGAGAGEMLHIDLNSNATAAAVQELLRAIAFTSSSDDPTVAGRTAATIAYVLNDGDGDATGASVTVNVTAVDDYAAVTVPASAITFTEGDSATVLDASLTVVDPDGATMLNGATVTIGTGYAGSQDVLGWDATTAFFAGVSGNYSNGVLTFTGEASASDYQAVLRTVTYTNTNNAVPSTADRTITFAVSAATGTAPAATDASVTVHVVGVPDLPTIDLDANDNNAAGTAYAFTYPEGAFGFQIVDNDVHITSVEEPITTVTVTLTDHRTGDELFVNGTPSNDNITFTAYNSSTGVMTVNANGATASQIEEALRAIYFRNTTNNPGFAGTDLSRSITFTVHSASYDSNTATTTVTITEVNQAAVITGTDTGSVTEDGTTTASGTLVSTDPDSASGFQSADLVGSYGGFELQPDGSWGYSLFNAAANVQALAGGQQVFDTFTIHSADGTAHNVTITVNGTNDAPVVDLDGGAAGTGVSLSYTEASAYTAIAPAATVTDVDSANFFGGTLTVTFTSGGTATDRLTVLGGNGITFSANVIRYNGIDIATWAESATHNGLSPLVITLEAGSTPAAVQALLRAIAYQNISDDPGATPRQLSVTISDGDGGTSTAALATINVLPVNDAPAGADKFITFTEDTTYTFAAADFGFSDNLDHNAFLAVRVSSLPLAGTLRLNGNAVSAGDYIAVSEINAGHFTFVPAPDGAGNGYATFSFQVQDDGGTANGGTDLDQSPNAIVFNVTNVPDPSVIDLNGAGAGNDATLGYTENSGATAVAPAATLTDPDATLFGEDLTISFTAGGTASDRLTILGGNGISFSVNVIRYNGVDIATWGNTTTYDGLTPLVIHLEAGATPTAVQALLRAIAYSNVSENPSTTPRDLSFVISGNSATSNTAHATINVTATPDFPSGTSTTVTAAEDTAYTFTYADFGYSDPDGDAMAGVYIHTNMSSDGRVYLNGTALHGTSNFVSIADINSGLLTFLGAPNGFGAAYATFGFQVVDVTGNATGLDQITRTMTVDVTGTPDPSVITGTDTGSVTEDGTTTASGTLISTDPDGTPGFQGADLTGSYGGFVLGTNGAWNYTLLNNAAAVQHLHSGQQVFDTFTIHSADGTAHDVVITVNGTDDYAQGTSTTVTATEDTAYVFTYANFGYSDADGDAMAGVYIHTNGSSDGRVYLNGVALHGTSNFVSIAQINAGQLTFLGDANANGAALATFGFQVVDTTGNARGLDQTTRTMTVDVSAVNDAPVFAALGGTVAHTEGGAAVVLDGDATVADAELDALNGGAGDYAGARLTVARQGGQDVGDVLGFDTTGALFTVNGNALEAGGLAFATWTRIAGTLTVNFTSSGTFATSALVDDVIRHLSYVTQDDNPPASVNVNLTFSDRNTGAQGSGGALEVSGNVTVNITAVNDAPEGIDHDVDAPVTGSYTFTLFDFRFSDPENDALYSVTFDTLPALGTIYYNGTTPISAGATFEAAEIAAGLLTFVPAGGASIGNNYTSFTYIVRDVGGAYDDDANTITIDLVSANNAPTVANAIPDQHSNEDAAVNYTFPANTFDDADMDVLTYTATLDTGAPLPAWLSFDSGTRTFSGTPPQDYNGTLHLRVTASDGTDSVSDDFDLIIDPVNDAPVITAPANDSTNEDASFIFSGISVTDPDIGGGDYLVTLSVSHGTLTLVNFGNFSLGSGGSFAISAASVAALLDGIRYTPDANYNGPDALTITIDDQGATGSGGALHDTEVINITVASVNDAPAGTDSPLNVINEDTTYTFSAADFGFTDPVEGNAFLSVIITTLPPGGTLTLSGVPVTAGQEIPVGQIGNLVFTPPPNANGTDRGMFTFQVRDDGGTANGGIDTDQSPNTFYLSVAAVNDAPVNTVGGAVAVNEDTAVALSGISIADAESGPGETYTVLLTVRHGTLTIRTDVAGGITGANIVGGGQGTNGLTLTGTLAQINATLAAANGLTYQGDPDYHGSDSLQVSTREGVPADAASFAAPLSSSALSNATSLVTGDVNGDGRLDLVYIGGVANQIGVRLGNGDGTFGATTSLAAGTTPTEVILADVDGDNDLDIVSTDYATGAFSNGAVGIRLNDGSGNFGAYTSLATIRSAYDVVAGDVNGDGRLDLIVDRRDFGKVSVLLATGAPGNFAAPVDYDTSLPNYTTGITLGDFNNDGRLDIIAFNQGLKTGGGTGTVSLLLNNGNGTFGAPVDIFASGTVQPYEGTTYDLNNDGNLDLVFANYTTNDGVTVMLGNGNGTFGSPTFYATTGDADEVRVGDVNGDGIADIVTSNGQSGSVAIFLGNGNGSFQSRLDLAISSTYAETPTPGDFNGDGRLDIAVNAASTNGQRVLLNTGTWLSDTDTRAITVNSVNDAPSGTNGSATFNEDTSYTFSAADFGFSDTADGNAFLSVFITTLPTAGTLRLSGNPVTAGQEIPVGQIGNLVFTPAANANGTGYASLTFQVRDDGGTANGGVDTDQSPNTFTLNVASVNDAPVIGSLNGNFVQFVEGSTAVLLDGPPSPATVTDIDSPDFNGGSLTVHIGAGAAPAEDQLDIDQGGTVSINAGVVSVGGNAIGTVTGGGAGGGDLVFSFNSANATPAAIQALLRAITYTNSNTVNPSTATRTVTWTLVDGDGTANGGVDTRVVTTFVSVSGVNDAPSGTDATLTLAEDGSRTLTTADFGFSDSDGNVLIAVYLTTLPAAGTLLLNGVPVTVANTYVTKTQIDAGQLVFQPAPNGNGTGYASFTFQVQDDGGTANGGIDTDQSPNTITFDVTAVNDGPTNSVPGAQTTNEDIARVFSSANANAITVADIDSGAGNVTVTLTVAHGTLTAVVVGGVGYANNGTSSVVISGTVADVNTALNGLVYTPAANYNGSDTLQIQTSDNGNTGTGGALTDTDSVAITINALNDAPSGTDATLTFNEDATYTFAAADFGFSDPGEGNSFLSVFITTLPANGTLTLSGNPVLAGQEIPVAQIGNLVFTPAANANGNGYASFTFQVRDDGGTANGGVDTDQSPNTITFDVTAVNDGPVNSVPGAQSTNEDIAKVFSSGNGNRISVADLDVGGGNLTVTLSVAHGALTLSTVAGLSFGAGANGTGAMTFTGTAAAINTALNGLSYLPAANYNGPDILQIQTSDNGNTGSGGTLTDSDSVSITVASINDAPAGADKAVTINEDSTYTFAAADFGFADPNDTPANTLLAVKFTTLPTNGTLFYDADGAGGNAAVAITAGQSILASEIALGKVTFVPAANANGSPLTSFTFQVQDDGGTGSGGVDLDQSANTFTFNVSAVNDAPVNSVPGAQSVNEDAALVLSTANANAIQVSDVDAASGSVSVTLSVAHGTLTLASTSGLTLTGTNGSASFTISGTLANLNAALGGGLTYAPTANYNGPDAISVQTTDNGNTGSGGAGTDSDSIAITVNSVNDAPSGTNNMVTGSEDDPYVFTATDFGFSDTIDGNALQAVKITTLPGVGTLFLDSDGAGPNAAVAVTAGQFISAADIAAGHLYYLGALDGFGSPYASFTFQVQDNGGTANGGVDLDQSPNTLTINLTPDNRPPAADLNGAGAGIDYSTSYTEDGPAAAIGSAISVSDPDSGRGDMIESATITLTDKVAGDSLSVFGALPAGITANIVVNAGSIVVTLSGTASQADYATAIGQIRYATTSQNPDVFGTDTARTITVTVNDGEADSAVATTTININAVDDAPVAQPDQFVTTESGPIAGGNLFANHGSGADDDPDGPGLAIDQVNGSTANVGAQITLASGALLTVRADGTFDYDPNGAFLTTPVAGSGAANTPSHDSFTYRLAGGNTVTVTIALTGLDTDDVMLGTAGADELSSDGGFDQLFGFGGNDVYHLADSSDLVYESVGGGTRDEVYVVSNYTLAAGVEVEVLSAASLAGVTALVLVGNEFDQTIYGNAGANYLDGGSGNDTLVGFGGDDSYVVDDVNDYVAEFAGGGNDIVYVRGSFSLGAGQEVETLAAFSQAGTAPIVIVGNGFNQTLYGNAGANYLDGGSGNDTLVGFGGDDSYVVDDVNDYVAEFAGGGNDIVYVRGSFSLGAGQEVETLAAFSQAGTAPIVIIGNGVDQRLFGNNGDNYLDGGGGTDILQGFAGNDSYVVDSLGDYIVEVAGEGNDVVYARASYALGAGQSIEILSAISNSAGTAMDLTGNELSNQIYGSGGANIIDGGQGADYLQGYGGADTFAFTTALGGGNVDTILDFVSGSDRIALDHAIFTQLVPGALPASIFHVGASATDEDQRIIYDDTTGNLYYDADGLGGAAQVLFATLTGQPPLTAGGIIVI